MVFFSVLTEYAKGQEIKIQAEDSLLHKNPTLPDTVTARPPLDSIIQNKGPAHPIDQSDSFYNKLAENSQRSFLSRELRNIIIIKNKSTSSDTLSATQSIIPFVAYYDQPIRRIFIKELPPFGPTISDTTHKTSSFIERAANNVHIKTRKSLIYKSLLFKEGDNIDPEVLADNERLLRNLPYIEDVKIVVLPTNSLNDSVDVMVLTKDVWPKAFNVDIVDIYSGRVELWDKNIFGFGHENQNNILWNSKENPSVGYEGFYRINNIAGSYTSSQLHYYNSFRTKSIGINFQRMFLTPNEKYGVGASFENTSTHTYHIVDTVNQYIPLKYQSYDVWVGRSFKINRENFSSMRENFTIIPRIKRDNFDTRPDITQNSFYIYQNKTLILNTFEFSRQNFFKSNLIYNFGRTEDIPIGAKIDATVGYEFNEFSNRKYGELGISGSKFLGRAGYLYCSAQTAAFFNKNNDPEQGVFESSLNYFTGLFILGNFRLRQFLNIRFTRGINRYEFEHLNLNERNGIIGFRNDSLYGSKRLNIDWETDCFCPGSVYGFKFVVFAFADHSWLVSKNQQIFNGIPYTGIGIGVRIRNERLVFNTFQIRLAFYPNLPKGSAVKAFDISGEPTLSLPNFSPTPPQLIPY